MTTIYMITSPSGKKYVGQTKNLAKRKHLYKSLHCRKQPMIYRSLVKYGFSNHIFEVLEVVDDKDGDSAEIRWITAKRSYHKDGGMNLTRGGTVPEMTSEIKQKISRSLLGSKNVRSRTIYQYDLTGNFIKAWKCLRCVQRDTGWPTTALSRAASSLGRAYGFLWSYHKKRKLVISSPNKGGVPGKKVFRVNTLTGAKDVFDSILQAEKLTGISRGTIKRHLKGHSFMRKRSVFTWQY